MPRRLLLAPFSAHDATDRLLSDALELAPGPDYRDILCLAPSKPKMRDAQMRFARLTGRDALVSPRFATTDDLAMELHERHSDRALLSSKLRPLVVRKLLSADSGDASLGYARAVSDFIASVKRHVPGDERPGLRERLNELLAAFEKPLARVNQALDVMERYESLLGENGWLDEDDRLSEAASLAQEHLECRVLVLDGFAYPYAAEEQLLEVLVHKAEHALALAWSPTGEDGYAARFPGFLRALGGFEVERLEAGPEPELELRAFNSIDDEVRGICRDIKRRFLGRELDLGGTFIAFPSLSRYAPVLERMLDRYGIPYTIYPSPRLSTSPPVVAVLELLTAIETGYDRLAFAAVLSSPFFPNLLRLSGGEGTDSAVRAARRVNVESKRAGIIKGRADWSRIGSRLVAAFELEGKERDEAKDLERRVRHALGLCDKLLWEESRRPWQTLGEYAHALKQFLEAARFRSDPATDPEEKDELRNDRRQLYNILDDIIELDRSFGPLQADGPDFARALSYAIRMHDRDTSGRRPEGITVTGMTRTLGLHPKHLYFAGLTEPDLPAPYPPDPILPDWVRTRIGMPDIDTHRDQQQFDFDRTLASCREAPFLCFHNSDADSPVLPTPFLDLEPQSRPLTDVIYSQQEHQQADGEQLRAQLETATPPVDFSTDKEVLKALSATWGPSHSVSVTRLESYRRCPFLFYLEHILGLESLPEPAYEIDAAEWGLLVHQVLAEVYAKGPAPLEQLPDLTRKALDRALADSGLPVFWQQVSRKVIDNFLPEFMAREKEMREQGFQPTRVEASVSGEPAPDLRIHGRVDRVDEDKDSLRVIDYKTGSTAFVTGKAVTKDRTHVQLPLYARLLQDEQPGRLIDNLGVWSVRDARVKWLAGPRYPVPELIQAAIDTARETIHAIRAGRFPVQDTDPQVCRNCDLGFLCGRQPGS
ncbi:MAG: PD-(D/E)XK nuclease family protein [candidate division WOR-3 bacterium]|nr:MAG: PD-(D/E)XK nuclease family protein [candidate division WOR-3 bacterium]